jgi:dienelactone hydrolase
MRTMKRFGTMLLALATLQALAVAAPRYEDTLNLMVVADGQGKLHPVQSVADWERRRGHLLDHMQAVMGPMPDAARKVPLDLHILEEIDMGSYVRQRVDFAVEEGDRLPAYLCIPKEGDAKRAAVLCLHPTGEDGKKIPVGLSDRENRHYGDELARKGYITLSPDYVNMGDYAIDVYARGYASASMKGIWNHMRCVDLLQSLPMVDPERIGCIGHSLGGHNTLFLGVFDPRVKVLATSCGFNRFAKYYGGDLTGWSHKGYMPRIAERYGKDPKRMPFDFPDILAALAPRPVYINAPENDANFDVSGLRECVEAAKPVYALYGAAAQLHAEHPECEHDFPEAQRLAAYAVIDSALNGAPTPMAPLSKLERVRYNNPGLVVDLGVGLWAYPLPCDYDGDGDMDLLVATPDKPANGIYFFENPGGQGAMPVFKPGVRLDSAVHNLTISYTPSGWIIQSPGEAYPAFQRTQRSEPQQLDYEPAFHRGRDNQWKRVDFDGDGDLDLVIGASDWREYGWDDGFDARGQWTRGPLHAYVYVVDNAGTDAAPVWGETRTLEAGGVVLDVYGAPSPNFADFDGDGDLDLVCGSFMDTMTYYENTGTRTAPVYAAARPVASGGEPIVLELQMLQVVAVDWDADGDTDLIVGKEDGRVVYLEHTGKLVNGAPDFAAPRYFQQEAEYLKVGALATPSSADWDADGDEDLLVGDTAGFLSVVENLDGGNPPRWAAPVRLHAGEEVIRIQAGYNGSIQGPCEAKWGYTVPSVADWNHDGLPDILVNSIWGEVLWYKNVGTPGAPALAPAEMITVRWKGKPQKPAWNWWNPKRRQLVTQWRTTPYVTDWNQDGLNDLVMLDAEGYLAFFERTRRWGRLALKPGARIFMDAEGEPLQLNPGKAGKSGRRKLAMTDWDGDGKMDLLLNSVNADFWRNVGEDGAPRFENLGLVDTRLLAGHSTCPTTVDWDRDGRRDLLIGAEDGMFYYLPQPRVAVE